MNEEFIAVLDYGIGNLRSAEKALQYLGASARMVDTADQVQGASGVILPGVGAFGSCASALGVSGLEKPAREAIEQGVPFLGICVGFQLLYERSEENPDARGLAVFDGCVRRLPSSVKHPQMQWNEVELVNGSTSDALAGLPRTPWVYFVHSFAPEIGPETVATCEYGGPLAALAEHENVWGTQFHPEKSGSNGLAVLSNFVAKCARSKCMVA